MSVPCGCAAVGNQEYVVIRQRTWGIDVYGPFSTYEKAAKKAKAANALDQESLCFAVPLGSKKNL